MKYLIILIMFILSIGNAFAKDYIHNKKRFDKMVNDRINFSNQLEQYGITDDLNYQISNYASMPYGWDFTMGERSNVNNLEDKLGYSGIHLNQAYDKANVTGLSEVHQDGWTGEGAEILIIDDFQSSWHGTMVWNTSLFVAPDADYDLDNYQNGIDASIEDGNYNAINLSLGFHLDEYNSLVPHTHSAAKDWIQMYKDLRKEFKDAVIVYAAGNNGDTNQTQSFCNQAGGRDTADSCTGVRWFYDNEKLGKKRVIFVGAYDSEAGDLTEYSVSAGDRAKNDFIVADGNSVSAWLNGEGTSFAAPKVSGAIALLTQKYPNLDAKKKKKLLLFTADDLGAPGVDNVYGHGLLNVGKAMSPFGQIN